MFLIAHTPVLMSMELWAVKDDTFLDYLAGKGNFVIYNAM